MSSQTTVTRDTAAPKMSDITAGPPGLGASSGRKPRLLLALTSGLLAALILNLVLFDDLRTDATADIAGTFLAPQHLTSILACLLAVVLLAVGHRSAARVAAVVAWIEIAAFTFFHGIPVEVGPAKPYWGDGMGDLQQWVGFLSILALSAAVVSAVQRTPKGSITPAVA
jgi:hypothetical protein